LFYCCTFAADLKTIEKYQAMKRLMMNKARYIKVFCVSTAIVVPLTVDLLIRGERGRCLIMAFLFAVAIRGLLKMLK
jgi:hypothetical protein